MIIRLLLVFFRSLFLSLLLIISLPVTAHHSKTEPSDGTVRSFRAVAPALEVPRFPFQDSNGKTIDLGAFKGKVVLLNVWATWCGPCIHELPALNRLQKKFADSDFVVLPVSIDTKGLSVVKPFYDRLKLDNLKMYSDANAAMRVFFPVDVVPANFIINRDGMLVSFLRSYIDWDDPEVTDMVNFYLKQAGSSTEAWASAHPPRYRR